LSERNRTLAVSWEYGPAEQQHIRDANRADDCPDDLSLEVDDGTVTAEGSPETIRWLYDYLHYLKRAWRQEGEQWDADVAEEMAESLHDQVDGDLPERQRVKKAMTDGGEPRDFDPSDIDVDEPPEMPEPPMHEEWEGIETWSKANLRYPVPGGWDIDDHGKFHTTWKHEDGATLTRSSKRTPGPKDTFAFKLNGEEIHRVDTGPERVEMREETVWLLTFYDENDDVDSPTSFQQQIREERNASLGDFA
jgi:hypothetical protein